MTDSELEEDAFIQEGLSPSSFSDKSGREADEQTRSAVSRC